MLFRSMLNYTYGTNGDLSPRGYVVNRIDTALIEKHIKEAKAQDATHIVAFFHWGIEYNTTPSQRQKSIAMWCRENGVDVVIGSHPHVVQPIDFDNSIVYSLGNFVSNQKHNLKDVGVTLQVKLYKDDKPTLSYTPHWVDWQRHDKKYLVSTLADTLTVSNKSSMIDAIGRVEKIVNSLVEY